MKKRNAKREEKVNRKSSFSKVKNISLTLFLLFLFIITNIVYGFIKPEKTGTTTIAAIDDNYLAGNNETKPLSDYKLNTMARIEGSEAEGYYYTFPEEQVKEILDRTLYSQDVIYADMGTDSIDALMEFIKAEIFTSLPNISKDPENIRTDGDKIQGAVKFKRRSFDKEIGEYEQEVSDDEIAESDTSVHTVVIDAGHGNPEGGQIAGNYDSIATSEEELNEGKAKYLGGFTGRDSEGNLYNEWELNQKVVDLVIQKLSQYPSINIVQTGKDQPDYDRLRLAESVGADAYISVHFNDSNENRGTDVWISPSEYENSEGEKVQLGDNSESEELGNILLESISGQMNMGQVSDDVREFYNQTKSVLKTSEECGFPNVYVFGNNMDTDVLDELMAEDEQGLDDYAQGIVNGILEYFEAEDNMSENSNIQEEETENYLIYTSPENFDNMINNRDEDVLNYFTLDEDMNMIVATWTYSDAEGVTFARSSANEYITKIQQYVMPYQYPLAFLLDTGDESFARELANLSANSDIVMTVFDNVTVTADKVITTNTTEQRTDSWYVIRAAEDSENDIIPVMGPVTIGEVTATEHEPDIVVSAREQSTLSLQLTYADAWCVEYEKYYVSERTDTGFARVGDIERTEGEWQFGETTSTIWRMDVDREREDYERPAERTITEVENQTRTVRYMFKENPSREPVLDGNVDKFVDLIREHERVALSNIESDYGQGLIDILSSRESTSNMVELTKWLLQEASKKIYFGLVKYEFEIFDPDNFTSISTGANSSNMLLEYLKSWENDAIYEYQKGQISFSSYVGQYITEDKKQYVCYTDGGGRLNFAFGVMHYNGENFACVDYYQSLGIDITQYGYVGATLDVEIVDKVMVMEMQEKRQAVINKMSAAGITLNSNQLDALTAITYQWGQAILDDFISAYQQYGDTEELRYNFHSSRDTADYPLYTGNATDGVPSESAKRRGEANWAMFHEGRYVLKDGTELNPDDFASDTDSLIDQNSDGIYGVHTAFSGKKFIEYRQMSGDWGVPPWASVPYWEGTIATDGCGPTAAAIALTGYGVNVTPADTANAISTHFGAGTSTTPNTLTWVVNNFGVSAHTDGWQGVTSDKIANNLRQGRPVLISVSNRPDNLFTNTGHLMALIDIDSNDRVYVSNPSTKATGWYPLSTVIQYCSYKWAVYFDE